LGICLDALLAGIVSPGGGKIGNGLTGLRRIGGKREGEAREQGEPGRVFADAVEDFRNESGCGWLFAFFWFLGDCLIWNCFLFLNSMRSVRRKK
jgi:hypothetical protein